MKVFNTFRSAIALETVDGATLEDVDISNVTATNKNVRVHTKGADYRPALVFDDVRQLTLRQVTVPTAPTQPTLVLQDVVGLARQQVSLPGQAQATLARGRKYQFFC